MYGTNPSRPEISAAMQALKDQGVATVTVEFSGGNDDGGVDSILYKGVDGTQIDSIPRSVAHEDRYWQNGREHNRGWVVYDRTLGDTYKEQQRPATADEILLARTQKVLESPIYERWGSFAGEFYVHGTLTWDVATGKHTLSGQESHEVWEDF